MDRPLDLPPVWLAGFMGVTWVSRWVVDAPSLLGTATGGVLITAGLALGLWSALTFWQARTTIIPRGEPSALVEGGPYALSRNPIYVADLMILGGWSLWLGAPLGLILLPVFYVILLRRFIMPEEALLAARLGDAYDTYCKRVRRWI